MDHQPLPPQALHLLAISGSLRAASSNTTILRAAALLAPTGITIALYGGLATLPPFNPDLDQAIALPPVADFRAQLQAADGVLISSPEYAHGVPGALKNALDWVVGSGELMNKPVALISVSPHSRYAQASLTETLTVMMARGVAENSWLVPLTTNKLDEATLLANTEIANALRAAVVAFAAAIEANRENADHL